MEGQAVALVTSVRASMERGDSPLEASVEVSDLMRDVQPDQWRPLVASLAAIASGLLPDDYEEAQRMLQVMALQMAGDEEG